MATKTADAAQDYAPVRANQRQGTTTIISRYQADGATISSGDVFWMAKIPHGAVITNIVGYGKAAGVGGVVFNVGTTGSASLFGPFTISATAQYVSLISGASATQQFPYTVSLSDDATPRYVTLAMTQASGTATATGSFGLVVTYLMGGSAGP